jgi:hypothetical protein
VQQQKVMSCQAQAIVLYGGCAAGAPARECMSCNSVPALLAIVAQQCRQAAPQLLAPLFGVWRTELHIMRENWML